jgi:hypothetical protein
MINKTVQYYNIFFNLYTLFMMFFYNYKKYITIDAFQIVNFDTKNPNKFIVKMPGFYFYLLNFSI